MSNYGQSIDQNGENMIDDDFFDGMSKESIELLKRALSEKMDSEIRNIEKEALGIEMPPLSKRHKIRMNRLFRERVGGTFLPFPEADNFYERTRSKLVIKFRTNKLSDHPKKGRRAK